MKVALVHDYLNQEGGAERVASIMCSTWPGSPLYTSVYDAEVMSPHWQDIDIRTSFMQRLGPSLGRARSLLPLYPFAFESFDFRDYDTVVSSCSTFAKGIVTGPETRHVCYCHTPARYAWMYHEYTEHMHLGFLARTALPAMVTPLRVWDLAAASRVDQFIANSTATAERIAKYYRRDAIVLHPPLDASVYTPVTERSGNFLVLARLQSYKRLDLAVEACTRLRLPLIVAGDGPDKDRLQKLAGPTVRFLGRVSDDDARQLLATCEALISPGLEDLGLTPLESLASGRPVVAFGGGGALETLVDGSTGKFFYKQTVVALADVLSDFDASHYDSAELRRHALAWDVPRFQSRLREIVERRK